MLAANRHEEIIKLINKDRFVKVSQLSRLFDVSEETIRRYLDKLERDGFLKKLHGGAVPVDLGAVDIIKPIMERITENINEKIIAAKLALSFIDDGDTIILDSGSTMLQLARLLENKKITAITNDISIAYELSQKENISLLVTGGNLKSNSFSLVGPECEKMLGSLNVNKTFVSASGISIDRGLTTSDITEASIKKAMINAAEKVFCVADHSKFEKVTLVSFAPLDCLDILVTDRVVGDGISNVISEIGVKLVTG
jgi:DeoR/GlpR family transcriptional regulator of sugar metabolism